MDDLKLQTLLLAAIAAMWIAAIIAILLIF
jgi:hypothetical protein